MKRLLLLLVAAMCVVVSAWGARFALPGGGTMYYEVYGEGTPVLLLHGHSLDHRMWAGQVELLKDKYKVIVPDMRGYGLSSDPEEGYQFTHLDDVLALLDKLGIQKVHVIGLSMGAYVAGDFLGMHPERLLSCTMLGGEPCTFTGPSRPRSEKEKAQRRKQIAKTRKNVERYKREHVKDLLEACYSGNVERIREELTQEIMDWRAWQALHVTGRVYYGLDAYKKLVERRPKVPTLIVYGSAETNRTADALYFLPNGRQMIFDHCGHMVNLEQPELLNATLLLWLEEQELRTKTTADAVRKQQPMAVRKTKTKTKK